MTATPRIVPLVAVAPLAVALLLAGCDKPQTGQAPAPPSQPQSAATPDPGAAQAGSAPAGSAQAAAGPDQGLAACAELGVDPTTHIAACSSVIDDPAASPHDRAIALNNRGVTRMQQGDNDGAIADYTAALAINPQYDAAFYNRAKAERAKGDDAKADADAAEAVSLNPGLKGR
jgi:tetratricopeptide (TPR) repeat protein